MHLVNLVNDKGLQLKQRFVSFGRAENMEPANFSELSFSNVIKNDRHSVVGFVDGSGHCLKIIRPISWHEYIKYFWRHSRLHKEINGNNLLRSLGLNTAKVLDHGVAVMSPFSREFLGYIIMENLNQSRNREAHQVLMDPATDSKSKDFIVRKIIDAVNRMKKSRVLFSDLHLKNIMIDPAQKISFIDTGVSKFSIFSRKKYQKKFNASLDKLVNSEHGINGLTSQHSESILSLKF